MPPQEVQGALTMYGRWIRSKLESFIGTVIDDRAWKLAQLSEQLGGLGLRGPGRHAPAAYLASFCESGHLASSSDSFFDSTAPAPP